MIEQPSGAEPRGDQSNAEGRGMAVAVAGEMPASMKMRT